MPLTSLQRVYQVVEARLYRAETRSGVAEEAWSTVTVRDRREIDLPEKAIAAAVRAARTRAVAIIVDGKHPPSITESAIVTLDHALYAAALDTGIESVAASSQSAPQATPRRGPRL